MKVVKHNMSLFKPLVTGVDNNRPRPVICQQEITHVTLSELVFCTEAKDTFSELSIYAQKMAVDHKFQTVSAGFSVCTRTTGNFIQGLTNSSRVMTLTKLSRINIKI